MINPPIQLPPLRIPLEECDRVMGRYIRNWDQLELALFSLFHKLLDTDITTASIVFDSDMNLKALREITVQLGKHRLSSEQSSKLKALMRRVSNATTTRNRLVHGRWVLMLAMGSAPRPKPLRAKSAEWARMYRPSDRETLERLMQRHQKEVANFHFAPERIDEAGIRAKGLAKEINKLTATLVLRPPKVPSPVEW